MLTKAAFTWLKKTVKTVVVMIGGCNTRMTNGVQQTKGQIY